MESIDIKELLAYFKTKISIILIITITILLMGFTYCVFIQTPKYMSTTSILLKNDTTQNKYYNTNDASVNKNLVTTYSEIVKSKKVLNKVIHNLNLDYNYTELYKIVEVSSVQETELIKIVVKDENALLAKEIANEVANVFVDEVPELYNISNVSILDKAEAAKDPYNINIGKELAISLILGVFVGSGIVFSMYYFDRTIKSREQIENRLNIPILGEVQEYTGGNK